MISVRAQAMMDETKRYTHAEAGFDKDAELCMNILPLFRGDRFPIRLAIILETNGPIEVAGKPCPRDSLKTSPFCSKCKRSLRDDL